MRYSNRVLCLASILMWLYSSHSLANEDYIESIRQKDFFLQSPTFELLTKVKKLREIVDKFESRRLHPEKHRKLADRWFFLTHSIKKNRRKLVNAESRLNKLIVRRVLKRRRPHPSHLEAIKNYLWLAAESADKKIAGHNIAYILSQEPGTMDDSLSEFRMQQQTRILETGIRRSQTLSRMVNLKQYKRSYYEAPATLSSERKVSDSYCPVCMDSFEIPGGGVQLSCGHSFCKTCLSTHLSMGIEARNLPLICPQGGCTQRINANEMAVVGMSDLQIAQWKNRQINHDLRANQAIQYCQTADCPGLAVFDNGSPLQFNCCYCHEDNCAACGEQHSGSCQKFKESRRLNAMTQESEDLINRLSQKCPHCQYSVTRVEGEGHCYKMKCPDCRKYWLWVPGKKVGRQWKGYEYHDQRGETFSRKEQRLWERRNGVRYR